MARTDKLPADPSLPHPDSEGWTDRTYDLFSRLTRQVNLLTDGYLLPVTTLPTPDASHRGRTVTLQGTPDRVYTCLQTSGGGYAWVESATTDPPYLDLVEIAEPTAPGADTVRVYAVDQNGHSVLEAKGPAGTTRRLARDNFIIAKIKESGASSVAIGDVLYISGASGANEEVKLAKADSSATMPGFGIALEAGGFNDFIKVIFSGKVSGFNTSAFTEGNVVYVSTATAGKLTATPPVLPNLRQRVGVITRSNASTGEVLVQVSQVIDVDSARFVWLGSTGGHTGINPDYSSAFGAEPWSGSESLRRQVIPAPVTITGFTVKQSGTTGVGSSNVYTIRKDGVATAATVTIAHPATTGSWTGSVAFAADTDISVERLGVGSPSALTWIRSSIVGIQDL